MRVFIKIILALLVVVISTGFKPKDLAWGFYAHREINRLAIYTLPPEMIGFFKSNRNYLIERAVVPDKRRHLLASEASHHYIDIDNYGDSAHYTLPRFWNEAVDQHSEEALVTHGDLPWHIYRMKYALTLAMKEKRINDVLRLAGDIGHYIGDAHVPLHTTRNYDGQLTGQEGIHSLWETRLPELFANRYDFFVGRATYINNCQLAAWSAVISAHNAVDSVLAIEKLLSQQEPFKNEQYAFEVRGQSTVKTYSKKFSHHYHEQLLGMVERQMRRSIKMTGDFWYTCWVDAGQPDLSGLSEQNTTPLIEIDTIPAGSDHDKRTNNMPDE